jgi:hypothetical protein
MNGLPDTLKVIDHMYDLAFASTDFKLQSKTLDRLILCLAPRKFPPYFSLSTIQVLASRVKLGCMLRTLGFDAQRDGVSHLTSLQHPAPLGIWNSGYDDDGKWNSLRCDAGIRAATGREEPEDEEPEDDFDEDDYVEADAMQQ